MTKEKATNRRQRENGEDDDDDEDDDILETGNEIGHFHVVNI